MFHRQSEVINSEVQKLLLKGVIEEESHCDGEFISSIFLRPKNNGSFRMILNPFVQYHHFKMDTFESALALVTKGCFWGSVDLKDAHYSVPSHKKYRKYLRFRW